MDISAIENETDLVLLGIFHVERNELVDRGRQVRDWASTVALNGPVCTTVAKYVA